MSAGFSGQSRIAIWDGANIAISRDFRYSGPGPWASCFFSNYGPWRWGENLESNCTSLKSFLFLKSKIMLAIMILKYLHVVRIQVWEVLIMWTRE